MIVETANSSYEIDETSRTVTRVPMSGSLRRDAEPIHYVAMGDPVVGQRLDMVLNLRSDGVQTYRVTSPVLRILEP